MTKGEWRYYDGCLSMLGLLNITGNFKAYLRSNTTPTPPPPPAPSATITSTSPSPAAFDKANPANITVNLNLNGNTLSSINRNGVNLTQGNNGYTVSGGGNTVTLRSEYLDTLPNGVTTLTFVFSAGNNATLNITISNSDPGGGDPVEGGGTAFTFETEVPMTFNGSGLSASYGSDDTGDFLILTKTGGYSSPQFVLTFNLGDTTLADYSNVYIEIRGVSGDLSGGKEFTVKVNNNSIISTGNNMNNLSTTDWTTLNRPITAANAGSITGDVQIAFGINNTNPVVYQIKAIRLIPNP
jgi:hypothetical protein